MDGDEEDKEKKTAHLHIRLTKEEKKKLKKLASQYGLTVSDFIRFLIHYIDCCNGLKIRIEPKCRHNSSLKEEGIGILKDSRKTVREGN